jgi:hypothetical protein
MDGRMICSNCGINIIQLLKNTGTNEYGIKDNKVFCSKCVHKKVLPIKIRFLDIDKLQNGTITVDDRGNVNDKNKI